VVDPGVATDRRRIAGCFGPHAFVCPDNGLLTPLLGRAKRHDWPVEMVKLKSDHLHRGGQRGRTFERDERRHG
jgi:S-adenosylmethionine hydrolase